MGVREIKTNKREDIFKDIDIEIGRIFSECNNIKRIQDEIAQKITGYDKKTDEYFLEGRLKAINYLKNITVLLENNNTSMFQKVLNISDMANRIKRKMEDLKNEL